MQGRPVMPTHIPSLTIMALIGFCIQAHAQDRCPELTRLRGEAAEALKQTIGVPARCDSYNRLSKVRSAMAQYASDHRESRRAHAFKCGADILVCGLRRLSSRQFFWNTGLESPVNPQVGKPAPQMRRFRPIETKDLNASTLGSGGYFGRTMKSTGGYRVRSRCFSPKPSGFKIALKYCRQRES